MKISATDAENHEESENPIEIVQKSEHLKLHNFQHFEHFENYSFCRPTFRKHHIGSFLRGFREPGIAWGKGVKRGMTQAIASTLGIHTTLLAQVKKEPMWCFLKFSKFPKLHFLSKI